jgi:hypothetical protein
MGFGCGFSNTFSSRRAHSSDEKDVDFNKIPKTNFERRSEFYAGVFLILMLLVVIAECAYGIIRTNNSPLREHCFPSKAYPLGPPRCALLHTWE